MLRRLPLKRSYRSYEDDLLADFYIPCLGAARRYSRAVGYFSSAALSTAAAGLGPFIRNGGTIRLVFSPHLHAEDARMIATSYANRERVLAETVTGPLASGAATNQLRNRFGILGWLIRAGRLDIRIAITKGQREPGIYHEKLGVFADEADDRVGFHGSANESRGGLVANFESIMVSRSWVDHERLDVELFEERFERLWRNETSGLDVLPFPTAARELLIKLAPRTPEEPYFRPRDMDRRTHRRRDLDEALRLPTDVELRSYQEQAITTWLGSNGRGLLAMATGTGKTVTALAAASRLSGVAVKQGHPLLVLILCPYQHLVTQWTAECERFGVHPILCYRSRSLWEDRFATALRSLRGFGERSPQVVIATYATFQTKPFQKLLSPLPPTLLIADEAHNLGSVGLRELLPEAAQYRLGLSATPERHLDDEGTASIERYFGGTVFEFGLREALHAGALVPYDYRTSVVELDGEEIETYVDLTRRIGRALGGQDNWADGPAKLLLIARARLIANARAKIPELSAVLHPLRQTSHNLVYCGDGSREHDTGVEASRQIDDVVKLVGYDLGMRTQSYTAETPIDQRGRLRSRFSSGDLQVLVAIRCLDEGVDIPATQRAFVLASSTNPRQFIQRRGRVLRPAPGKTSALIHDFIAVPPPDALDKELWDVERRLAARELERAVTFAELARNSADALDDLAALRDRYALHYL